MLSLMLMITRDINSTDRSIFNRAAGPPLQAYEWGLFREKSGLKVARKGVFDGKKLTLPLSVPIHPLPGGYTLGYFPKGPMPDETQLEVLKSIGRENNSILIKLEPNVGSAVTENQITSHAWESIDKFLRTRGAKPGRPLFTRHTWQISLRSCGKLYSLPASPTYFGQNLRAGCWPYLWFLSLMMSFIIPMAPQPGKPKASWP